MSVASERIMSDLLRAADAAPVDALVAVIHDVLRPAGVRHAVLYLSDYQATYLRPAPGSTSSNRGRPLAQDLHGNPGRCFRDVVVVCDPEAGCVWAPVVERADVLGVLELSFERVDDNARRLCRDVGVMLGHLVVTARKYTDVYELLRRRRDMNLAAEMHWDVLPATTYVGPSVAISGDLEPAYEIGGDAFDYCLNNDALDFTLMDAMGHGLEAALLSVQAMSSYRYGRRRRQSLEDIATTVDDALLRQFAGTRFTTGLFCRLDLARGALRWVNAGHVSPLLVRGTDVEELDQAEPACPLGIELLGDIQAAEAVLRPGDRVLLYSDGVVEARAPDGQHLEMQRLVELVEEHSGDLGLGELSQRLIGEVVRHSAGPLRDDATVLLIEYRGPR